MTSEISELSVADGNNQIFQDISVRRPSSANKRTLSIGYGKLTNVTCHRPNIAMNLYSITYIMLLCELVYF